MAEHATDYTRGQMDIREQEASFEGFVKLSKWGSLAVATLVLFATMWFCTGAGFGGGLVTAIIVAALGIYFLREKPASA